MKFKTGGFSVIMKSAFSVLVFLFILFLVCSCVSNGGANGNRDDVAGIYYGVIPAADCPGISVVVILGSDNRYKITYQYIDRDAPLAVFTGIFTRDNAAKMIILDSRELPPYYKTGSACLIQLDMEGKEITGDFAGMYELRKVNFPAD